ncbi:ABC transporter substrate-binding protein [Bradyrhizobium centrosematis]|uniref:ABC transporter substrate-binding protein n=1 Tax=Bradyrhizobium centrosematis TaxID=1300039 RepID=UPI0038903F76
MNGAYALTAAPPERVLKRGGDTWFFITADFAFGKSKEAEATKRIQAGGDRRRRAYAAGYARLLVVPAAGQESGAKIMALATAGSDTSNAIKQAQEYR